MKEFSWDSYSLPLIKIRQHHFPITGDVFPSDQLYLTHGHNIADGGSLGVALLYPQAHRDVVGLFYNKSKALLFLYILRHYELNLPYFVYKSAQK